MARFGGQAFTCAAWWCVTGASPRRRYDDFIGVDGFDMVADLLDLVLLTDVRSMSFPPIFNLWSTHIRLIYTGD